MDALTTKGSGPFRPDQRSRDRSRRRDTDARRRAPGRGRLSPWSLRSAAGQVFLLQVVIVLLLVAAAVTAVVIQANRASEREAARLSVTAAQSFANAPGTAAALRAPNPTAILQPRAEAARKAAGVDFILVMTTDGTRLTYPDPKEIGKKFVGTIQPALEGRTVVEQAGGPPLPAGTGTAVQAVVPVFGAGGSVVGLVSAGITSENVGDLVERQVPLILGTGAAALALSVAGTALVSRRLRRQTRGMGPAEMTRMYEHHDAVLHAVREGVLITGADGHVILANDEARRLLDLPADIERRRVADLGLEGETARLLASAEPVTDAVCRAGDRLLAVNKRPTAPYGGHAGSVVTLRDTTELATVTGRAEIARERLKLLYDAGVRVGATLDVRRTAEELAEVSVPQFADAVTVELRDAVLRGEEPPPGTGTELRRTAARGPEGGHPGHPVGELVRYAPGTPVAAAITSGRAVLEAGHGVHGDPPARQDGQAVPHTPADQDFPSLVAVPMRARGALLGVANFWRAGDSAPFEEEDKSLAEELAARAAVAIDNARRYTREHAMAVTLQRSLLPRGIPDLSALEAAYRYLPARAGVGGDWFDVISLSGARVALVVGDVVGHGLHAAATMGRLRTAVHNFSTLDLPPDELLGHLDELVADIDTDENADDERDGQGITGATCLYAVYDPVSGRVVAASAGHPGPAVVHPDGTVSFPRVPVSPPLGLGAGLPFETAEVTLPEGSQLVLYTDGLIEDRDRDLDAGMEALRAALTGTDRTPEATCSAVIDAMLPAQPSDDIVLLVARTRRLDRADFAEWEVPRDPAAVAPVRSACARRLADWGLDDISFATELILSELITNAIRYGGDPITVRLLHGRNLICEVSDGSSTSPHLRRARTTDEGGRGLFLVAQYAERWGTRYTAEGKIIWTEQPLHDGAVDADALGDALLDQWSDEAF
ncbi:GAF domain-containing protein [Streptomyces sp. WAC05374]|uniref:SpoIIE family protein phosphatase n=1 Tax=Streptomyces sp. WAC05374 TaxID=2487420 RepID=UPI000F87469A|nr:SpoIIE family protein phosphatase [Streptomyces sp. WAC05374]RST04722.1 GAF domain-containing protein [Streptomyces sp. WAC05374]TDF47915.1 GAF domain-containing protein [Streptomyces sp. WAC05374]TDF53934.1 GAF domain-containing protein [Streptomyces sp. WAC05374]